MTPWLIPGYHSWSIVMFASYFIDALRLTSVKYIMMGCCRDPTPTTEVMLEMYSPAFDVALLVKSPVPWPMANIPTLQLTG